MKSCEELSPLFEDELFLKQFFALINKFFPRKFGISNEASFKAEGKIKCIGIKNISPSGN